MIQDILTFAVILLASIVSIYKGYLFFKVEQKVKIGAKGQVGCHGCSGCTLKSIQKY